MPRVTPPIPLTAYPSSTEGVWVFPWALAFDPSIHDPADLRYQVQIDTFPTFASNNLIDVSNNSATIINFQNGPLGKAVEVQLPKRQTGLTATWYWRVRYNGYGYAGGYSSDWSETRQLTVPEDQTLAIASTMFDDIADSNSYSKEANSSNLYKLMQMLGREFDQLLLENSYTERDLSIDQGRDAGNDNNFSRLVQLSKITTEPNVSHRWKTRELFKSFLSSAGSVTGIKRVVKAFVGEEPTILDATTTVGWILPYHYIKDPDHPELTPIITLYSAASRGFQWTLQVWNSWNLSYDQSVLENYVNGIKPAHTKTIFSYQAQRHVQLQLNSAADWNAGTLVNLGPNASGGLTITSGTSGTATTPVFRISGLNAWSDLQLDRVLAGQTLTVELRSSPDGSAGFSSYETVLQGQEPVTTPLQDYIQLRISLSTSNAANKPILNSLQLNMFRS